MKLSSSDTIHPICHLLQQHPSETARAIAAAHNDQLTKPAGSLGRLEELALWFASITTCVPPTVPEKAALLLFAGDHGVTAEGVSAYPKSVTASMVRNILSGGAAINTLSQRYNIKLHVIDIGVDDELIGCASTNFATFHDHKIQRGTGNIRVEPALTIRQHAKALMVGKQRAEEAIAQGAQVLGLGEMGIGNTTPAAALVSYFTGKPASEVVGRGTGIDDAKLQHKISVVSDAVARVTGTTETVHDAIAGLGGFEFSAMIGAMIAAANCRVPVVLDGFLSNAAAVAAYALEPGILAFLLASHRSTEAGANAALEHMSLEPLLDLKMRLGEGTGAVMAIDLLRSAVALQRGMATFESAAIDGPQA